MIPPNNDSMGRRVNFEVASTLLIHGEGTYLSRRANNGLWQNPGGKLFLGEDPRDGAQRELEEETGLLIPLERFIPLGVEQVQGHSYRVHCFAVVLLEGERPRRREPKKNTGWRFIPLTEIGKLPTVSMLPFFLGRLPKLSRPA